MIHATRNTNGVLQSKQFTEAAWSHLPADKCGWVAAPPAEVAHLIEKKPDGKPKAAKTVAKPRAEVAAPPARWPARILTLKTTTSNDHSNEQTLGR